MESESSENDSLEDDPDVTEVMFADNRKESKEASIARENDLENNCNLRSIDFEAGRHGGISDIRKHLRTKRARKGLKRLGF